LVYLVYNYVSSPLVSHGVRSGTNPGNRQVRRGF